MTGIEDPRVTAALHALQDVNAEQARLLAAEALPFFAELGPVAAAETADAAARLLILREDDPAAYLTVYRWMFDVGGLRGLTGRDSDRTRQ